ncbi:MAG: lipid A deacylase LpxR family protein [Pseudomonadota bacterium]
MKPLTMLIAIAALVVCHGACASSPEETRGEAGTVSFILENDLFYGPDRHYTQGLQANYMFGDKSSRCLLRSITNSIRLSREGEAVRCGFGIGQSIFTPRDLSASEPLPDQRPYAGWLYLNLMYVRERPGRLDTAQLNIGVVGPSAFGEFVQNEWHDFVLNIEEAQGWDNQLRDEPGIALILERRWRCREQPGRRCLISQVFGEGVGDYFAIEPHLGLSLGNVHTHGAAGVTARLGFNLRNDYGAPRIRPALAGTAHFRRGRESIIDLPLLGGVNFYAFAGIEGRAVARNIFLDGNTWRDSLSVEKRNVVGDLQAGGVIQIGRFQLGYTHVIRTKEFMGQEERDRFGAVMLQFKGGRF